MRVRATCDHCGREVLLFELYHAAPALADRCPHCSRHLGVTNVRPLAYGVDRAGARLVEALHELADRNPRLHLDPDSVLGPIREALDRLAAEQRARAA